MRNRTLKFMTLAATAVALSACVAPGLNPTTNPKPPATTKPPAPAPLKTSLPPGDHLATTIKKGVFRVVPDSWVQIFNTPTTIHFGAPDFGFVPGGATSAGTWLATVFSSDYKVRVGDGTVTYIGPGKGGPWTGPAVNPLTHGYTNGAYLVGHDLPAGTYTLTSPPGGTAQYEIFTAYSVMRECSRPLVTDPTDICHGPTGAKLDLKFTGSRTFTLTGSDYILHFSGILDD